MIRRQEDFEISTDPNRLDVEFIHRALDQSYWARGRPQETVVQSIQASLCFGVYTGNRQVGFARVVGDGCTFSWICDVWIDPAFRGRGLGKRLMEFVVHHPRVESTKQHLRTRDAHGLYERYGFQRVELMVRERLTENG